MKTSPIAALAAWLITSTAAAAPPPAGKPPVEGVVVKVADGEVVIDLGHATGLPDNPPIALYRRMVVQHPISGETIEDRFPIGTVRPAQVGALLTIIRDTAGLERPPVPGDFVVYHPPAAPAAPTPPVAAAPSPTPGAAPPVAADTAALRAIFEQSLAQSLPRRIALYESFVEAFPQSAHTPSVGRELVSLRAMLAQTRHAESAPATETIADSDGLTVRHLTPRPVVVGETVEVALALVEPERVVEVRLLAARQGAEAWQTRPMQRDGDYYYRATLPSTLLAEPGVVHYVVEAVRPDGRLESIAGHHARPVTLRVDPLPPGQQPPGDSQLDVMARYVDFNSAGEATDAYFQFETTFTYELALWIIRAVRVGVGVIDGEGGETELIDVGAPTRSISLNYAFAEAEIEIGEWVGIATRLIGGNRQSADDDPAERMTGVEARLRIGRFDETRVVAGVSVLDVLGAKGFLDMHIEVFDRLPMRAGVVVTNLPVDADIGVQLDYQIGWRFSDLVTVHAQVGWNARTINHYGFTGGGGLTLAW